MTDTEKAALERRIDELCQELHKTQVNLDMWVIRANVTLKNLTATRAENAKLREEVERLHADQAHWELGNCPSCPNVVSLQEALDTNAKLRELCEEQLDNLMPEICAKAWWCEGKDWHTCNDDACGNYTFVILARELGVEVD